MQTTTERAEDISRSDETTAANTSNERIEELTTGIDLTDSETSTVFDDGRNGSSSGNVLLTRGEDNVFLQGIDSRRSKHEERNPFI